MQIDIAEQSVSKMLSGTRTLTDKTLAKVAKVLDIPFEVLKYGEGLEEYILKKPFKNEAIPIDFVDETDVVVSANGMEFRDLSNGMVLMTMPFVDEFAYASYPHGWKDPEYVIELPKYSIVLPTREKGFYRAFEVRGDSMSDGTMNSICYGDVAIGRLIEPDYWDQKLYTNGGTDYIVVTHDGVIIKRIMKHDVKEGIITCASINPDKDEYPDFTIRLSEVYELYKIRKIDRDWNRR
ncbi:LexA family transcriptional regulator [Spirosoma oryzicola]|uniref:LexA family transcriptional regulator n=1 Tax=Spirosoma oryzicola TaxID=2898794 RepID=UPI001E457E29|nr:LexA family transcriptional regulator [Spirosoma oryzicola]UHG93211.1 LexA family transcriptional regulator [Spirosoma oryzicola]